MTWAEELDNFETSVLENATVYIIEELMLLSEYACVKTTSFADGCSPVKQYASRSSKASGCPAPLAGNEIKPALPLGNSECPVPTLKPLSR